MLVIENLKREQGLQQTKPHRQHVFFDGTVSPRSKAASVAHDEALEFAPQSTAPVAT